MSTRDSDEPSASFIPLNEQSTPSENEQRKFKMNAKSQIVILRNRTENQQNEETTSEIESDDEKIIMSAYWKNNKFAASYFNVDTSELYALNEIADTKSEYDMFQNMYRQVKPSLTLIESRAPKTFVNLVKNLLFHKNSSEDSSEIEYDSKLQTGLYFLFSKEYDIESCKQRIFQISLPNEPPNASQSERELFLNSIINFRYTLTVHAIGSLLKYLDKNLHFLYMDSKTALSILSINMMSMDKIVTMNDESFKALQIFNKLSHPSNFKKGTAKSSREGLSLFSVFNKCCSKMGTKYLKLILQQPTTDVKILQRRLDTLEFCNKPGNEEIVKNLYFNLKHIKNVNGIMTRIKSMRSSPTEWKQLIKTINSVITICETCEKYKDKSSLLNALGSIDNEDLFNVANHVKFVINFEVSKIQGKFIINSGVDSKLDEKKKISIGLHELMTSTANFELQNLPEFIKDCSMTYMPNLGYFLCIISWKPELTEDERNVPNLKFMFQNGNCIYYKSRGCDKLDCLIGDTYPDIITHEMRIITKLTNYILPHLHALSTVVKLCAELDCLISIAKVCKDNGYSRPILKYDRIIEIHKGRHPLQELCVETYVPNDTLATNGSMVNIITGPNSCGKSIYLKQIALIVYMAHIGSYVPAEFATVGLIDEIFTRIQTVEDVSTRMSAFLIDLRQISHALLHASNSSLVIIDEFGKGTTEVDGLALLAACVNNFLFRCEKSPFVFVSTHFLNLNSYLIQSPQLKQLSMDYMIQDDKLIFLYNVVENVSNSSFAHKVAEMVGIPEKICSRAKDVLKNFHNFYPKPDESLEKYRLQKDVVSDMRKLFLSNIEITSADVAHLRQMTNKGNNSNIQK